MKNFIFLLMTAVISMSLFAQTSQEISTTERSYFCKPYYEVAYKRYISEKSKLSRLKKTIALSIAYAAGGVVMAQKIPGENSDADVQASVGGKIALVGMFEALGAMHVYNVARGKFGGSGAEVCRIYTW